MKTNRRGFLGRALAGAAAVAVVPLAKPEAAQAADPVTPEMDAARVADEQSQRGLATWDEVRAATTGGLTVNGSTRLRVAGTATFNGATTLQAPWCGKGQDGMDCIHFTTPDGIRHLFVYT